MKKVLRRLSAKVALAATGLLGATAAFAQEPPGPYLGIGAGANWLEALSARGPFGGNTKLNYDVGPIGTAAAGYAFGNGFRGELELGYRHSDAKNITVPSGATLPTSLNVKTNAQAYSYMVNGLYDFALGPPWSVNLGVGVGAANVRVNNVGHVTPFAWQAMSGLDYSLTPQMKLGLEYKFLGTDALKFKSNSFFTDHPNYYDHAVLVTFRYNFGVPAPAQPASNLSLPPPPPPSPGAGATAPPLSRNFTVYFATNSASLSPTARDIVRQAANAAKENAPTRINVGGHTDTVGAASYNQQLSRRRAEAVRRELIADGVPPDEITTTAYGESDLAVPTADSVNEPRNRRVIIVVQGPGT